MIFFPKLYVRGESPRMSQANSALLYDRCIRPTIHELLPLTISHWPISYDACMRRIRDSRGQFHFTTLDIPDHILDDFTERLRNRLDAHPEFRDSFFVHEWRGIKGYTGHDPVDDVACDTAIDAAMEDIAILDMYPPDSENAWFIDVAIELSSPDKVLQWRTDSHLRILQYAIPTAERSELAREMRRRSFHKDISSHLYDLAGLRMEVHPRLQGAQQIHYVNCYTTDKSATYQLHRGAFRRHRAEELFPHKIQGVLKDIASLSDIYDKCTGLHAHPAQLSNGRLEVRLALRPEHVTHKFRNVTPAFIRNTIVGFHPVDWW